jgi:O-acetyl-ADP-ribose deacetylase (regulator of RNase III)
MIRRATGTLLNSDAEALVNTVNSVGVMGKGIALQFKRAFPDNYAAYAAACKRGSSDSALKPCGKRGD